MVMALSLSYSRPTAINTFLLNAIFKPRFNTTYQHRSSFSSLNQVGACRVSEAEAKQKKKKVPAEGKMTIKPAVRISSERNLVVKDQTILVGVPENVIATSGAGEGPAEGVFLGAVLNQEGSSHVVPLGTLREVRFLACFRFKLWWMAQRMGNSGRDIPLETQFILVESKDDVYTVFLPMVEGPFKALTGIKENAKFQKKDEGINNIVRIAKEKYALKYVYVWHAITGYWGGVRPGEEYKSAMQYPKLSKGVMENEPGWKTDAIAVEGLGLVNPKNVYQFYNELHSYLASAEVDGVKVDVQCILETLGAGLGGRVQLTTQYHQALDASIARNFPDNGCIACMSHNLESLYCSKQTAIVRASDDFYPRDPMSHTIHIAAVAYNSIFLGEIMLPDWDMFHSLHPAAEYHGSARAISGGPVYVSDAPGKHNFDLLRKLVLPDGSILRARLPGRPTKDCLFSDPARDGVSLLKIWNMNKYTGVVGVYNCQGAAWNRVERKNTFHETKSEAISGYVRGTDAHLIRDVSLDPEWNGSVALYSHRDSRVIVLPHDAALPVSLKVLEHEIFTVTPVRACGPGLGFAPFGLIDMFNAGGAIEGLRYDVQTKKEAAAVVSIEVKGCGRFGAYSSTRPRKCTVGGDEVEVEYEVGSGLVTLDLLEMPPEDKRLHSVVIEL
ncbi:Probable galactinol--sucrose galactosyltransferase 6 [Striga hermonthica]|uniref:Probable galactinol--sucrose galactosyltransferase 6 n=1 Tax=Striga hermonthica TaxID=68872 RepID=A0A9N7MND1_STRHE|nr:Probable galactinol--sucrose galactosyltransferase 6 [Striga hermonthica]